MHDIRAIRENPAAFDAALARRGLAPQSEAILAVDQARRAAISQVESAKAAQNAASKEVGAAKARGDEAEFARLRALVAEKKAEIARLEEEARGGDAQLTGLLEELPNTPLAEVPEGADESDNVEIKRWGEPRAFDFTPREHYAIEGVAPGMDFELAAKLAGSRFVVLRGAIARLHRALAQFMTDLHVEEHGLTEVNSPVLVRDAAMYGTGQLPKFAEDSLAEHARMTRCAETVLERLGLPYRTIVLCTGDMGFGAQKTHDIEVWLPGQGAYREISSVSTCGDFQARRMNARYRAEAGGKPAFLHTLNGSGVAVGRCLIAVLENGQRADGGVDLPEALHPYLRGRSQITPEGALA